MVWPVSQSNDSTAAVPNFRYPVSAGVQVGYMWYGSSRQETKGSEERGRRKHIAERNRLTLSPKGKEKTCPNTCFGPKGATDHDIMALRSSAETVPPSSRHRPMTAPQRSHQWQPTGVCNDYINVTAQDETSLITENV